MADNDYLNPPKLQRVDWADPNQGNSGLLVAKVPATVSGGRELQTHDGNGKKLDPPLLKMPMMADDSGALPPPALMKAFQTAQPDVSYAAPRGWAQGDTSKIDLHQNLTPVFPIAKVPQVALDQNPQHQVEGHLTNELQRAFVKDANPYGSANNHPGKMGKFLHTLAEIGNIAGDVLVPGVMERLPGTQANDQLKKYDLEKNLNDVVGQESENEFRGANTAHLREETNEMPAEASARERLEGAQSDKAEADVANGPDLAQAYAHAVSTAIKNGVDPAQDPIVQHLGDAITAIQKQPLPKGLDHVSLQDAHGKPYGATYDPNKGKYFDESGKEIANPIPYEKPISVNAGDASLDRLAGRLGKPYQSAYDAATGKFDRISQTLHSLEAGYTGQALAIPELLTALVSGQGTGIRVTQSELNAITAHRGLGNNAEGWFNSLVGKGRLTDQDKGQIRAVLSDARQRLEAKQGIVSDALDSINGASSRAEVQAADKLARQRLNQYETKGFYVGQHLKQGVVTGFTSDGKVQVQSE